MKHLYKAPIGETRMGSFLATYILELTKVPLTHMMKGIKTTKVMNLLDIAWKK
jgi:hypothetical protein